MGRKKEKNWKGKYFSLDVESIEKLKELSNFEGMSQSEFVDFIIKNWDTGIDPTEKLIELQKDREKLQEKIKNIDDEISKVTNQIKLFGEWKKQKSKKKTEAIKILERKILDRDFENAERVSKVWQRMTGIPALELLMEAQQNIERKGI